jgi:RNA polymerase sigma-70 factor (ECF subfamily)
MNGAPATLIFDTTTFRRRAEGMQRSELERELERLHPECWGWALACCRRDREIAEDVLQSAYLRMLSGRARFDGRSSVKTWVFGVIRMTAREELRRRWRWTLRVGGNAAAHDVADRAPRADDALVQSEHSAALLAALDELSPRQREVLHLVFYHGMTIEQAAGVMGVSLGSARTHYERGKKALAARLEAGVRE